MESVTLFRGLPLVGISHRELSYQIRDDEDPTQGSTGAGQTLNCSGI